jgi:hypothetical protein
MQDCLSEHAARVDPVRDAAKIAQITTFSKEQFHLLDVLAPVEVAGCT